MPKLKLSSIEDEKPVKMTLEIAARTHRDLVAYGEVIARVGDTNPIEPARLVGPMLAQFMATDREFAKRRRERS